jgi:plasmid maintenance system antidote protein VapI
MTMTQPDRERIAARWLIEQDDPHFSGEQREELARWLMESIENCHAYLRLVRAWRWTALLYRDATPVVYTKRRVQREGAAAGSRQPSSQQGSSRQGKIDRQFGSLLRAHREAKGLSQSELAARAGLRAVEISRLETGARTLTLTTTYVLARALGIAPSRLVSRLENTLLGKKARPPGVVKRRRRTRRGAE